MSFGRITAHLGAASMGLALTLGPPTALVPHATAATAPTCAGQRATIVGTPGPTTCTARRVAT